MLSIVSLGLLLVAPQQPAAPAAAVPTFSDARALLWQPGVKNAYPRWSKDGKQILFQSNRTGKWQIYVMDADGKRERRISTGDDNANFPDWSPDNTLIAFVSDRDGNEEVYVMALDGSGARNLTNNPARDIHPYWSPDGKQLLFNSTRDSGDRLQIFEMSADGSGVRQLVDSPDDDTCARIDAAGERFVYLTNLAAGRDDVMLRRRDGSQPVNVTDDRAPDGWPVWVGDGRRIVYSSAQSGTFCLCVRDLDGGAPIQLTFAKPPYADARASVSPDGKRIAFNRDSADTIGICVVELPTAGAPGTAKQ